MLHVLGLESIFGGQGCLRIEVHATLRRKHIALSNFLSNSSRHHVLTSKGLQRRILELRARREIVVVSALLGYR